MINKIKNKHLRRLFIPFGVLLCLVLSPFDAIYDYYPEFFKQLFTSVVRSWNLP
jgi:hypothetical protein